MTRYEKFKDGIEFIAGEGTARSIDVAVNTAEDFIDCEFCPCRSECLKRLEDVEPTFNGDDKIAFSNARLLFTHDTCQNLLKEYLSGEV